MTLTPKRKRSQVLEGSNSKRRRDAFECTVAGKRQHAEPSAMGAMGATCKRTCVRSPLEEELVQLKHEVSALRAFREQAYKVLAGQSARVRQLEYLLQEQRVAPMALACNAVVMVH
jgi:hypothetical protein